MMRWLLTCALAATLLAAASAPSAAQDSLVLLSPHWEGIRNEFEWAFQEHWKAETGRDVDVRWLDVGGGTSDQLRFIRSEFKNKPDGIGVDLLFGGGVDPYRELKKTGLLAPHRPPEAILARIAPAIGGVPLYDPDHMWHAPVMSGFGIVYNKIVVERLGLPTPRTWADLARPEFFTWVGSADPRKSGSAHMAYEIILQAYGWEEGWRVITAMGANVRAFTAGASQTPKDVALGETACGLAIDFYAWNQAREAGTDRIGYALPDDLTVVNGDAIGLLRGAPNPVVAGRFIDFTLSEAGQKLWILSKGVEGGPRQYELARFCVMPSLYPEIRGRSSVTINPFEWQSDFEYDPAIGSARWGVVNDLVGTQVIDAHGALQAAWEDAIGRGDVASDRARLGAPPVSEAEAMAMASDGRWRDAEFRNRTLREWALFARRKYGEADEGLVYLRLAPGLAGLLLLAGAMIALRRSRR